MLRSLLSAAVLACVLLLAPTGESQKEISSAHATEPVVNVLSDLLIATAHAHPCAIVVMASNDPGAVPLPKPKPHFAPTKQKKKSASTPTKQKKKNHHRHHHSHHHHHSNHAPQKIFGAHGPSHLTQPPGCG